MTWIETTCAACRRPAIGFDCDGGTHFRHGPGEPSKWHWAKGSSGVLYASAEGGNPHPGSSLHLVEGETDEAAFYAVGLPVVGVIGAGRAAAALDRLAENGIVGDYREVVVWREPGGSPAEKGKPASGGVAFVEGARAASIKHGFTLRIADWPLETPDARSLMARCAAANRVRLSDDEYGGALSHLRLCGAIVGGVDAVAETARVFRERVEDLARDAVFAGAASVPVVHTATETLVGELEIPRGWRISERLGVEFDGGDSGFVRVIPVPLTIDCVEVDVHDGTERLALRWKHRGRDHFLSMPREDAASTRAIVPYARTGLPVTSENARGVVRWLHLLEHQQAKGLPRVSVARRSGWALGRHIHSASDMSIDESSGSGRLLSALHPMGEVEESEEFIRRVLTSHPMAACMIAASLAAPLLNPLRLRGFALHLWGDSRGGKTSAAKLALSMWGDPMRLMGSWSATPNAIEAHAATLCDMPTYLDELQSARSLEFVAQTVYAVANGVGRARATVTGDLGVQRAWRTIMLSTGEMPLLPEDAHDGARTRTIEVIAAPFHGETAMSDAAAAHDLSERVYGHLGPEFLSTPRFSPANQVRLREDHDFTCATLAEKVRGDVPPIKLRSAAALVIALDWLRGHVGAHDAPAAVDTVAAMLSVATGQTSEDDAHGSMTWKSAQGVLQLVAERRADFEPGARARLGAIDVPQKGEVAQDRVAWLTVSAMKLTCEQSGVPYRRARALLHAAGVLADSQAAMKRGVLDTPTRLYRVDLDKAEEVKR